MAQTGFQLTDKGDVLTVLNDSGTTAIVAGDIVYATTNNDVLTGTAASARNAYSAADIKVKRAADSATGYQTVLGVALADIPVDAYGAVATEGVWIHPVSADTEAGDKLLGVASANKVKKVPNYAYGTTATAVALVNNMKFQIGRALTGGSADGKYIAWKLTI